MLITPSLISQSLLAVNVTDVIAVQGALKFNGGGHINHSIFWTNLSPHGGGEPQGMHYKLWVMRGMDLDLHVL